MSNTAGVESRNKNSSLLSDRNWRLCVSPCRLIYWLCLFLGSTSIRAFGFGLSFHPILVMLGVNLYYVCSSMGQGAVFDVAPPTTAAPAARNWWGWRATPQNVAARKWGSHTGVMATHFVRVPAQNHDSSPVGTAGFIKTCRASEWTNTLSWCVYFLFRTRELFSQNSEFRWKLKADIYFIWICPNFLLSCLHTTDKNVILKLYIHNWQTIVTTIRLLYFFCYAALFLVVVWDSLYIYIYIYICEIIFEWIRSIIDYEGVAEEFIRIIDVIIHWTI